MRTVVTADRTTMGRWVAAQAGDVLRRIIAAKQRVNLVVATGSSQFEVLDSLVQQPDVQWDRVHGFHLDEYVGLAPDHPASFCRYLRERFVDRVPLASFEYLRGDDDPQSTMARVGNMLATSPIDLALVGIGENGHLAFNDPPADFATKDPYLLVELDEPCRQQQVGEGWFESLPHVPTHAISMSVQQIISAATIFCSVPDARKAAAVKATVEGPIGPDVPASILRQHAGATLIVDEAAASELSDASRQTLESV